MTSVSLSADDRTAQGGGCAVVSQFLGTFSNEKKSLLVCLKRGILHSAVGPDCVVN